MSYSYPFRRPFRRFGSRLHSTKFSLHIVIPTKVAGIYRNIRYMSNTNTNKISTNFEETLKYCGGCCGIVIGFCTLAYCIKYEDPNAELLSGNILLDLFVIYVLCHSFYRIGSRCYPLSILCFPYVVYKAESYYKFLLK